MFNGLRSTAAILGGMTPDAAKAAFQRHRDRTDGRAAKGEDVAHPDQMGMGMVLEARGNVYGDVRSVDRATKARRRAKNKAARAARRNQRGEAQGSGFASLGSTLLLCLFIGLKLTEQIDWSWWWVLAPAWIPLALVLVIAVVMFATIGLKGRR